MRLKYYSAPSMAKAMAHVREELGDDAIIVSTQRAAGGQGVRITAAVEEEITDDDVHLALSGRLSSPVTDYIRDQLVYHGLPPRLVERLVETSRLVGTNDPTMACAGALEQVFSFAPLPEKQAPRPFMLIGPPGAGKTVAVAKLATRGRLNGRSVGVISADTVRAGTLEQLVAFTKILDIDLRKARSSEALTQVLYEGGGEHDLVFIDTPGLNPFYPGDMTYLQDLMAGMEVEPILVMAAGGDPVEAAEMAEAFGEARATRLLATRLDMTRRLGAVLAAADAAQFMFCDVSINPHIADGLCPITPLSMARLLVPSQEEMVDDIDENNDIEGPSFTGTMDTPEKSEKYQSRDISRFDFKEDIHKLDADPEDRPLFGILGAVESDADTTPRIDRTGETRR